MLSNPVGTQNVSCLELFGMNICPNNDVKISNYDFLSGINTVFIYELDIFNSRFSTEKFLF